MEEQHNKIRRRRRSRKRSAKKVIAIVLGVLVLCAAVVLIAFPDLWQKEEEEPVGPTAPPPPDKVIHFVAGGNINITDECIAAGAAPNGYDFAPIFKDVLPVLASGDVTVLNFEGVLGGNTYGTQTKSAPKELLTALKNAGVDILQTANSYSVYDGLRGLNATLQGIRSEGLTPLGTYASNAEFEQSGGYIIWEIKGIKVAMMAFTKGMVDGMGLPNGSENCVNLLYKDYQSTFQKVDTEAITQIVRNAAAHDPDIMIAMVHWGSELSDQFSKSQKKICDLLQAEGVSAIIGTHPHFVQKMEFDPASGKFVAWSLGDLYDTVETDYSVLLDLQITQDGATGQTKVTGFEYVPVYLEKNEEGAMQLLRIEEAIIGYENQYLDRVSEETYNAMKIALERIKNRVAVK